MADEHLLPVFGPAPDVPLCQHAGGSCAACCGVDNFRDRSETATVGRLNRRTEAVNRAWPDVDALRKVRDELLVLERDDIMFPLVKACPFAGWTQQGEDPRVGCLIHPSRHPAGEDLRDLAVYPREVCAGHFCAPHDWLRPREVALAQTAPGLQYGRVVTDAGLVKSLAAQLDEELSRSFVASDLDAAAGALRVLWRGFNAWPWRDPDPRRFGGVRAVGDDATERTCDALFGLDIDATRAERVLLDGLASVFEDEESAEAALLRLRSLIRAVATKMERPVPLTKR